QGGRAGDGERHLADLLARRRHHLGGERRIAQEEDHDEERNDDAHRGESRHDDPPGESTELTPGCPDGRARRGPPQGAVRAHVVSMRIWAPPSSTVRWRRHPASPPSISDPGGHIVTSSSLPTRRPDRPPRAPRGTGLSCKGWPQEAALRMLMNNLDPDVAE